MTTALPIHRALSSKFSGRSFQAVTRYGYNPWLARVNHSSDDSKDINFLYTTDPQGCSLTVGTRSYATSTSKPVGRPKAHTGRTPAKRTTKAAPKTTTTKAATANKPGPKTAAGKSKVGAKPKAKTKAKPKLTPKKRSVKKVPTKSSIAKERRTKDKELREKALLDTPKTRPATAWSAYFTEKMSGKGAFAGQAEKVKTAAEEYKNFTPEQREHYNHLANANKEKNAIDFKNWLSQYTPEQIKEANSARTQLKKQYRLKHPDAKTVHKYHPLVDDRQVKMPRSPFAVFTKDRHATGDFKSMGITEVQPLIAKEWMELDASEKDAYQKRWEADRNRYHEEYRAVYGEDPISVQRATKAASGPS